MKKQPYAWQLVDLIFQTPWNTHGKDSKRNGTHNMSPTPLCEISVNLRLKPLRCLLSALRESIIQNSPSKIPSFPLCGNLGNLRLKPLRLSAFSLVEVVLALGIVGFALMGIMAVTSSSLTSNKDSHEISEELLIAKSLPAFLQSVSPANGTNSLLAYSNASNWALAGYSNIFACSATNGGTNQILITTNTGVTTSGRLFRLTLGTNATRPTDGNAAMGLRVSIRAVPDTTNVPRNNSSHVYDTAILP